MPLFKPDPQAALRKTLTEAQAALAVRPDDVRMLMKAAECESQLGMAAQAVAHYAQAARRYAEEGFLLKAVAVNKIALGLDGGSLSLDGGSLGVDGGSLSVDGGFGALLEREAHFYVQLDLLPDAFESLKKAIAAYAARGQGEQAAAARRKLLEIDPHNAAGRVAVAEHLVAQGKVSEALDAFAQVAAQLEREGNPADRARVVARVAYLERAAVQPV